MATETAILPAQEEARTKSTTPRRGVERPRLRQPESSSSRRAGRLSLHYHNWAEVTSNSFVLKIIEFGLQIHFHTLPPILTLNSYPPSSSRIVSISSEVQSLHIKTAISVVSPSLDQFVSPIFDVPKKDSDDCRVILNLKVLNHYIYKSKFKLEGYDVIINMLRQHDYMISIDLKDAFLMFSMHCQFHKYLCFEWLGVRYCYTCMPFGLTSAPRIFTKVLKSVLVFLRGRGLRITAWFDDLILLADSVSLLLEHLYFTRLILRSLGFLVNEAKSSLVPSQTLLHLGYNWDSASLTLSVPEDKVRNLKLLCVKALAGPVSLRFLQRILGTIESFKVAFKYAALHYRDLQREVSRHISSGSDWDLKITASPLSRKDLEWWLSCPFSLLPRSLAPFTPHITVTTDSSNSGWGAFTSLNEESFGFWSEEESQLHINVLETLAVIYAFKCFFRDVSHMFILVKSDNSTTVSYINHLGGVRSPAISELIIDLYNYCLDRNLTIKASFLRGRLNIRADALSRRTRDHCYSLPSSLFSHFCDLFHIRPEVDLFASRHNNKTSNYFSDGPDPLAIGFDAFSMKWPHSVYAFPPVMLVGKFLSYFLHYNIEEGLIVAPFWPAQAYFPILLDLIIDCPVLFSVSHLVGSASAPRPLSLIVVCLISTCPDRRKAYQQTLLPASFGPSTPQHCARTAVRGNALQIGVLCGKSLMATFL